MVSIPLRPASSNEKSLPVKMKGRPPERSSTTVAAADSPLASETLAGFYDLRGFVSQWSNDKYRISDQRTRSRTNGKEYEGLIKHVVDGAASAAAAAALPPVSPDIKVFHRMNVPTHHARGPMPRARVRASSSSSSSNEVTSLIQSSLKHQHFGGTGMISSDMDNTPYTTNSGGCDKLAKIWNRDMYKTVKDAMTVTSYMKKKDMATTWGDGHQMFKASLHSTPPQCNHYQIPQQQQQQQQHLHLQQKRRSPYSEIRPRSWNRALKSRHKPDRFTAPPITASALTMDNDLIKTHQFCDDPSIMDGRAQDHSNGRRTSARYHRKEHSHHHQHHHRHNHDVTSSAPPTIVGKRLVTPRLVTQQRYESNNNDMTIMSWPPVKMFSYYETQNAPHRRTMEDGHIYNPSFISPLGPRVSLIAVLDGHGGRRTAIDTVIDKFPKIIADGFSGLLSTLSSRGDKKKKMMKKKKSIKASLCEAFSVMDEVLRPFAWQHGLTATIILIKEENNKSNKNGGGCCYTVICGNVGDSRAILISPSGIICRLTQDHRPTTNAMETDRIVNGGGVVLFGRVGGQLAVSRALGDWCLKNDGVISEPSVTIKKEVIKGSIIVGASDGVWDVLSDKDVAQYVLEHIKQKEEDDDAGDNAAVSVSEGLTLSFPCIREVRSDDTVKTDDTVIDEAAALADEEALRNVSYINRGYTQVLVTGFICFCLVGFFCALTGLGGAGNANSSANDAANTALYATFAIFGYFGGFFFNLLGPKILMGCGGFTYAFYAAAAYISGHIAGTGWLFILSGAILGFGAGWLWTAQGALMMAYAPQDRKGHYIATFWIIFNLGGFVGGILQFAINFNTETDTANPASYFVFIAVMIIGSLSAFFLLRNPSNVVLENGSHAVIAPQKGVKEEFTDAASVILDKNMLMLLILFFGSNYFYTYVFNGVNGVLFTVRTRGLNSALYWLSQMIGAWTCGMLLDNPKRTLRSRGIIGFWFVFIVFNIIYGLGCYLQYGYRGGYDRYNKVISDVDKIDLTHSYYWYPCIVYMLYGYGDSIVQTFSYWIMGAISADNATLAARYTGFYKGIQSLGAAIAWAMDLPELGLSYSTQFWICWGLFLFGMPTTWLVIQRIGTQVEGVNK
ncbi:DUF895 domain membrane protein [Perkinsus chesapeaki]|uniref:DUF895 domain membrane protein n=1 Tax=Perkinsus chesapeaki TaxID=330153 RepID=A0A7J6LKB4_PERCH|nr:DUF895 domain membrane protein [Perkinsus chesapeaki]